MKYFLVIVLMGSRIWSIFFAITLCCNLSENWISFILPPIMLQQNLKKIHETIIVKCQNYNQVSSLLLQLSSIVFSTASILGWSVLKFYYKVRFSSSLVQSLNRTQVWLLKCLLWHGDSSGPVLKPNMFPKYNGIKLRNVYKSLSIVTVMKERTQSWMLILKTQQGHLSNQGSSEGHLKCFSKT